MTTADLIVIGAGPGGYEIAAEEARAGRSVVLIERGEPGGTCLNRGCIPTKCLCASADMARHVADADRFGVKVPEFTLDYGRAVARMREIVDGLRDDVRAATSQCRCVNGEARFRADGTVAVGDETFTAPRILIATGSRPAALNIPGSELAIDSDAFLTLESLPASVVVIGAGVIGLEFASIMNAFGVKVTVVEYCKEILPPFDKEVAKRLRSMLSRRGIDFVLGASVTGIAADGERRIVSYTGKKGKQSVEADVVLMAVGRRPVTPEGLAEAGIATDPRGFIVTNDAMETTREGVYAVGDCNGRMMLAHAAAAQARVAVGQDVVLDVIPSAVFTSPEAAMCGLTTEQCVAGEIPYATSKALFAANGKARAMGEADGLVKVVYEPETHRLLGCHIVGPHAADLIQEAATAIANGLTTNDIATRIVHGHPTLSEVVAAAMR